MNGTNYILVHHGVLGMKWGIRRYQNKDGSLTEEGVRHYGRQRLSKSRTSNMDKWGKDAEHNVLYISGYSGSGKSTSALSLARPGDQTIHLDSYSDMVDDSEKYQNKQFNNGRKKGKKWVKQYFKKSR